MSCAVVLQRVAPATVESVKATPEFIQFSLGYQRHEVKKDTGGCKEDAKTRQSGNKREDWQPWPFISVALVAASFHFDPH